ncbi:MAG: DUF2332 domain-containing protein [Ruegeria sp.]
MNLRDALRRQARACTSLDSPFMERLLTALAAHWPEDSALARACAAWDGEDLGPSGASLPLRIAAGLHALVLRGDDPALAAVYPPNSVTDADLIEAVLNAIDTHADFLCKSIQSPPQTNEVRRSVALIPAAYWIAAHHPLSMMVSELGASAGLNLMWDRFAVATPDSRLGAEHPALVLSPDWAGPPPAAQAISVQDRRGVDLNPIDPHDADGALRLRAYLWPDQPERMRLTDAAIAVQDATVDRGDAIDWLADRLPQQPEGTLHLIYHTVAWQYFPPEAQTRGTALIEQAGASATPSTPVAWLRMEADGRSPGASLTLRLWPGDHHVTLARVDFHGRWITWTAPAAISAT